MGRPLCMRCSLIACCCCWVSVFADMLRSPRNIYFFSFRPALNDFIVFLLLPITINFLI